MKKRVLAIGMLFLAVVALFAGTAQAQKRGGILRVYNADSPPGLNIYEQATPFGHHDQQPSPRGVVLLVGLEMPLQLRDTLAQQGNLNFWRPSVGLVALIRRKNLPLGVCRQCHSKGSCSLSSLNLVLVPTQDNTTGARATQ